MTVVAMPCGKRFIARFRDERSRRRELIRPSRVEAELAFIAGAGPASTSELGTLSVDAYARETFRQRSARGFGYAALAVQTKIYKNWMHGALGDRAIAEVTTGDLIELLEGWLGEGHSPSTARARTYLLENIFETAWRAGAVDRNVARLAYQNRRPMNPMAAPAAMPASGEIALLRSVALDPYRSVILELVLATRPSDAELRALTRDDVTFDKDGTGWVEYRFKVDTGREVQQYLPQRVRRVPLGAASIPMAMWLDQAPSRGSPYVFPGNRGNRQGTSMFCRVISSLQYDAEMAAAPDLPRRFFENRNNPGAGRPKWFRYFRARYSLQEVGNAAVLAWYLDGTRGLALADRMGCKIGALKAFEARFAELDRSRAPVQRAAAILRGAR